MDIATLLKAAAAMEAEEKSAKPVKTAHAPAVVVRGNAKYASHGELRKKDGTKTWGVYLYLGLPGENKGAMEVGPTTAVQIADYLDKRFDVPPEVTAEIRTAAENAAQAKSKGPRAQSAGFVIQE